MVLDLFYEPDSTRNGKRRFSFICARMCLAMVLDASWGVSGHLGASWRHLGGITEDFGTILGHLGSISGASGGIL